VRTGWLPVLPTPDCSQLPPSVTHHAALVFKFQSHRGSVPDRCSPTVGTLLVNLQSHLLLPVKCIMLRTSFKSLLYRETRKNYYRTPTSRNPLQEKPLCTASSNYQFSATGQSQGSQYKFRWPLSTSPYSTWFKVKIQLSSLASNLPLPHGATDSHTSFVLHLCPLPSMNYHSDLSAVDYRTLRTAKKWALKYSQELHNASLPELGPSHNLQKKTGIRPASILLCALLFLDPVSQKW